MVPVTLVVQDDAIIPSPVRDVLVRFYSLNGEEFITQAQTDESGEVTLDLEDFSSYWVRFFKPGYGFDTRLIISVSSVEVSNVFEVTAQNLVTHAPSTSPYLCRITGTVLDGSGHKARNHVFRFMIQNATVIGGSPVLQRKITAVADSEGFLDVELVRGAAYDVVIDGQEDEPLQIRVPNASSAAVADVLWPYVSTLSYESPEIVVAVADTVEIPFSLTLSNRHTLPYETDTGLEMGVNRVQFSVVSPSVATILVNYEKSVLFVTGESAGTTAIQASVLTDLEVPRIPTPDRSIATLYVTVQ